MRAHGCIDRRVNRSTAHHHTVHRFSPWHLLWIDATGAVLLATGLAWLGLHYAIGAGAGELPHPLEAWLIRLHGLAAYVGLFVFGIVAAVHVPHGWRASRRHRWAHQRRTGLVLCALAAALGLSGYLLYYFAPEWLRPGLGCLHAAAGVAMAACIVMHRRGTDRGADIELL